MDTTFSKLKTGIFSLLLAYPLIHGFLPIWGGKAPIGNLFGSSLSVTNIGLGNFLYISCFSASLLLVLRRLEIKEVLKWRYLIAYLPFAYALIRATDWQKDTIVLLENLFLLCTALFFTQFIPKMQEKFEWQRTQFWNRFFWIGYLAVSLLPLIFSISSLANFDSYNNAIAGVTRFQGLYGDPQVVGMLGYTALAWFLLDFSTKNRMQYFVISIPVVSAVFYILALTTYRASFLAIIFFAFTLAVVAFFKKRPHQTIMATFALIIAIGLQFQGALAKKNQFEPVKKNVISEVKKDITKLPINTSGRTFLYKTMFAEQFTDPVFGHGLGSSARYIRGHELFKHLFGNDPHSDLVRVVFDLGILGALLFIISISIVSFSIISHNWFAAPLIVGMIIFMCVSNPFVHPAWFVGPNFLLLFTLLNKDEDAEPSAA